MRSISKETRDKNIVGLKINCLLTRGLLTPSSFWHAPPQYITSCAVTDNPTVTTPIALTAIVQVLLSVYHMEKFWENKLFVQAMEDELLLVKLFCGVRKYSFSAKR